MIITKEVVKRVIERHGGKVDLTYGIRIREVPTKLKQIYFEGNSLGFQPVRINIGSISHVNDLDSKELYISTTASSYNRDQAREFAERLMFASDLIDELETEQLQEGLPGDPSKEDSEK